MNIFKIALAALALSGLGACGAVNPNAYIDPSHPAETLLGTAKAPSTTQTPSQSVVDMQAAEKNAFAAMQTTPPILQPTDSATACLRTFMDAMGIDLIAAANAASANTPTGFQPVPGSWINDIMVAYIKEQMVANKLQSKITIDAPCAQLLVNVLSTVFNKVLNVADPLHLTGITIPQFQIGTVTAAPAAPTPDQIKAILTPPAVATPAPTVPAKPAS